MKKENFQPRDPERTRQSLRRALTLGSWTKVDTSDPEAVRARIKEYFDFCLHEGCMAYKEACCLAIGISKDTWADWRDGIARKNDPRYKEIILEAERCIETNFLDLFFSGDIPTVNGIFYLKNAFGYKDQVESVVTHREELQIASIDEIRKKYAIEAEEVPRISQKSVDSRKSSAQKVQNAESAESLIIEDPDYSKSFEKN